MAASPELKSAPDGLAVQWRRGLLEVNAATHIVSEDDTVVGAVYGLLTEAEAARLVARLARFDDPADTVVEVPWAAAAVRPDGSIAVTCSTTLPSGLFWSVETEFAWATEAPGGDRSPGLIVATDPGTVVRARRSATHLNEAYLRDFALLHTDVQRTPYLEVSRAAAGDTLVWRTPGGAPVVRQWCGPAVWGDPTLEDPKVIDLYRETFDGVVRDLMARTGPLISTVSGGLDSTFVIASLALQTDAERPVQGFLHAPVLDAGLRPTGQWDPDDSPYAHFMEMQYPDRVRIGVLRNEAMVRPLDAARASSEGSWLPTFNPSNQVWMTDIHERAVSRGASLHFWGYNGNPAFSFSHNYAAGYYLYRRRPLAVWRTASRWEVESQLKHLLGRRTRAVARSVLATTRARGYGGNRRRAPYEELIGMGDVAPARPAAIATGRATYLAWLSRRESSLSAPMHPAALGGSMPVDPFCARPVLDLAAAITPIEWRRGLVPRAFARRAGAGRVPDAIRLRRQQGGQARDTWFWIRDDRERYLEEVALLEDTPGLAGHVDVAQVRNRVAAQPWGTIGPADFRDTIAIDRLLALAAFSRAARRRLFELHGGRGD